MFQSPPNKNQMIQASSSAQDALEMLQLQLQAFLNLNLFGRSEYRKIST